MVESVAICLVRLFYLYAAVGILFAALFVIRGVQKIDRQAESAGIAFRFLIFPASAALWPVLLMRWRRATGEPLGERNPHR